MKKKTTKSLFSMEIENNQETHVLMTALNMVGLNVSMKSAELIKEAINHIEKMGGKFDLETACKIQEVVNEKYQQIKDNYENQ
jgi:predicted SpoU family rRNA methylase